MSQGIDPPDQAAFASHWQALRKRLDHDLDRCVPQFFEDLPAAHRDAVRDVLHGGKRLRGGLVVLLNEALGGAAAAAIPRAMAIECVQAASLIHDDVVDGDATRRNGPALWTEQGPRRAILLGDVIFATALRRMAELGPHDGVVLATAIATMAAGAYQEPLASSGPALEAGTVAADLYPRVIALKTGVLFGAAAQLGALAAAASAASAERAFEYGVLIGEAYQILDDVHDLLDAPPDAAQLPLLSPAMSHFCADLLPMRRFDAPGPPALERLRAVLRERMLAAAEHRLQRAIATADLLGSGKHAGLLRAAPREIARATPAAAP
ncbi:polyprenyl synthetase family protein [Ramlibacter rhizophilus]|nr:polyprenyl synthetase family protein [Ramlibacter rhizophilus]